MVLAFLKNLVFPRDERRRYTRLDFDLQDSPTFPRARSEDEESTSSSSYYLDKPGDRDSTSAYSSGRRAIDPRTISDATIGLSDGLTVPFALTAGLSALGSSRVVIFGGLAELTAGAISMGLGGWLAARGEAEAYNSLFHSTHHLVVHAPERALHLAHSTLHPYLSTSTTSPLPLSTDPTTLTQFLLHFHHNATSPSSTRSPLISALTIASGYFFGGLIPLIPYFCFEEVGTAFWWSCAVMAGALFGFGWGKTWLNTGGEGEEDGFDGGGNRGRGVRWDCVWGGVQMVVLGGVAACAAMGLVRVVDGMGVEGNKT